MAKDKEVIIVEYDLRTVGAEKTKREIKDIERIREKSTKGRLNLLTREIEGMSEYKKIQKKRVSAERKALSQEKNLANQRIQLARNTARRVIRAIPKSSTSGWNDPYMPSQTPAQRVSFRRRRTRSQIQKDMYTDRFRSRFKNVGQVRPMYGPSNMYRQDLGFKIPRPSKLQYMTVGGNRMMQGPQFGSVSRRMSSYTPETIYSKSGRVNFASKFSHTGATRLMQGAEYRPFNIGPKTGAVSDRGISRAEIIRANIAESRRARQASNFGGPVKYGADYQQRHMQRASMDWMKSKTTWTPEKQEKMAKWLKAEAKAKDKVMKADEKLRRAQKEQSRKPTSMAKAMERTMLYGGFGMMASYMLRSAITSGLAV
ncbi:MAG: hypothetical protein ACRCX2_06990, partial [Paraclostridium sp.]